jgi:hypothetical protein
MWNEAACIVLAAVLVVLWVAGPWCRPMVAWASKDARWGVQVIAGRVNVHHGDQRMFKVWECRADDREGAWAGGLFAFGTGQFPQPVLGGIPLVGDAFRSSEARERDEKGLALLPRVGSWMYMSGHTVVSVPLVWVALMPGTVAVSLGWRRRQEVRGVDRCRACGYSLAGLESLICPECGRSPDL